MLASGLFYPRVCQSSLLCFRKDTNPFPVANDRLVALDAFLRLRTDRLCFYRPGVCSPDHTNAYSIPWRLRYSNRRHKTQLPRFRADSSHRGYLSRDAVNTPCFVHASGVSGLCRFGYFSLCLVIHFLERLYRKSARPYSILKKYKNQSKIIRLINWGIKDIIQTLDSVCGIMVSG